jgi:uncharacterized protein
MTVWIDADHCPVAVRRIVERAAVRVGVSAVFVAARPVDVGGGETVRFVLVAPSPGAADEHIRGAARAGDLAVTADIPLAASLARGGVDVIHPRGDLLTADTVGERLAMRDLLTGLRALGLETEGRRYGGGLHRFAAALDSELARRVRPRR